jgi:hypothetical protein
MVLAFLRPSNVHVMDTWRVTGLHASDSQDVRVEDTFVPDAMTGSFSISDGPGQIRECALTAIPFIPCPGSFR